MDKNFVSAVEKSLNILGVDEKINNKDYAIALINDWENVLKQNKFKKDKETFLRLGKEPNANYFDLAHKYCEEFSFDPNREDIRLFQKLYASYNLALNIPFDASNKNIFDTQTSLGYIGLSRIFYTYRFLENFVDYLILVDGSKFDRRENSLIKKDDFKHKHIGIYNFLHNLDRHHELPQLFNLVKQYKNQNGETILSYIDKKNSNKKKGYYHSNPKIGHIVNVSWLLGDIRNLFVHSKFSASSGSGNPLVTFIFMTQLSDIILKKANEYFRNEVLTKKYGYRF